MNHHAKMARLVAEAANALAKVNAYWEDNHLPGDFATPETGYPFEQSLDEQVYAVQEWAEKLDQQAKSEV